MNRFFDRAPSSKRVPLRLLGFLAASTALASACSDAGAPSGNGQREPAQGQSLTMPESVIRPTAKVNDYVATSETDPVWSLEDEVPSAEPAAHNQWYLDRIGARDAWATAVGSPDVVVAVLDTGFEIEHPDLEEAIWVNRAELDGQAGVDDDHNGYIDDVHGWDFANDRPDLRSGSDSRHGTHVAGIIGAVGQPELGGIIGVAHGVRIMPLEVTGNDTILASRAAEAIRYAVNNGARIINMSFGGFEPYSGLREAIEYASAKGVLLVAAAHNYSDSEYVYPAIEQEVVAVAALDSLDRRYVDSNYGRWVDLAAPGVGIWSTYTGVNPYVSLSGTSQAAPIVSGVAALIASAHPEWRAKQLRKQLLATAQTVQDTNPDYVGLLGAGCVNAAAAVGAAVSETRLYLAGVFAWEDSGNGDQEIGAGELASVTVSLHFTSASGAVEARLVSRDPFASVTSGPVQLTPRDDRSSAASFGIRIEADVPNDHQVPLTLEVVDGAGRTLLSTAVEISVAGTWRRLQRLPFSCSQELLVQPDGRLTVIADAAPARGATNSSVYATTRNTDGSFTALRTLSDASTSAECPAAVAAQNGDLHVAYHHLVAVGMGGRIYRVGYLRVDGQTGQVLDQHVFPDPAPHFNNALNSRAVTVGLDPAGNVHVAWPAFRSPEYPGAPSEYIYAARRMPTGDWTMELQSPIPVRLQPGQNFQFLEPKFVTAGGKMKLFVREERLATAPVAVLDYDEINHAWSTAQEVVGVTGDEAAMLPIGIGNDFYRAYLPTANHSLALARLVGTSWSFVNGLAPVASGTIAELVGASLDGTASFASLFSSELPSSHANDLVFVRSLPGGTSSTVPVPHDRRLLAMSLSLGTDGQHTLHASYGQSSYSGAVAFTGYTTQAPVSVAVLPSRPVVVDDGVTTRHRRTLHARWSSNSLATSYRFAWGTVPGADDIAPWQETTATEATVDLGSRRLLPGQTAYASVEARSNAVLTSGPGASDGITVVEPVLGDVDGDGSITITDALTIGRRSGGYDPAPFFPEVADVNCDGAISINDALLVARYSAKVITQFPCQ